MTVITNVGDWGRRTTVSVSADRLTAYQVRAFVRAMDDAGVPDSQMVSDRHSVETRHLTGLFVSFNETAGELAAVRPEDGA